MGEVLGSIPSCSTFFCLYSTHLTISIFLVFCGLSIVLVERSPHLGIQQMGLWFSGIMFP
ncbi:hypothetical protein BDW59DRAFT_149491 [Aspergillus cavernicola]|uniref:Uncharacterized protein n=1 Tax=Aspergillus cavernicola TaxID=176166 RepID=A0ABR4I3J9_9EURO